MIFGRSLSSGILAWLAVAVCVGVLDAAETDTDTHVLISDRVNGVHRDFETDLAPIEIGPVTVVLTSPTHFLEVFEHELRLEPGKDGTEAATLRARYQGQAHLVAELGMAGVTSEIDDDIELPLQDTEVSGRIEIVRVGDGYRVTALEAPSHVEIQVESDLAGRLGLLCRGLAVLAMGNVDCEAVDQAMSVVKVPLPEPGEEFFVASEDLTEMERGQIESYLRARQD
jgi:hypothetical protein